MPRAAYHCPQRRTASFIQELIVLSNAFGIFPSAWPFNGTCETVMGGDFFPGFPVLIFLIIATSFLTAHFGALLGGFLSMVTAFCAIVLVLLVGYDHWSIERSRKRRDKR